MGYRSRSSRSVCGAPHARRSAVYDRPFRDLVHLSRVDTLASLTDVVYRTLSPRRTHFCENARGSPLHQMHTCGLTVSKEDPKSGICLGLNYSPARVRELIA